MTETQGYKLAKLGVESAAEFRAIRLEALKSYPINFASAFEVECDWPLSAFEERLKQWLHVGAYVIPPPVGARLKSNAFQGWGHSKAMPNKAPLLSSPLRGEEKVLVGVATLVPQIPARMKHKADITSVYVKPDYQRRGVAKAMFAWLENEAAKQFDQVHLSVLAANGDACKLYEHLGYKAYGVEPRATKYDGKYYDDVFMVKFLK